MFEITKNKWGMLLITIIIILSYYVSNTVISKHYISTLFYSVIIPLLLMSITNFKISLLLLFVISVFYTPLKDLSKSLFIFMGVDIYFLWLLFIWFAKKIITGESISNGAPLTKVLLLFYTFVFIMGIINPESNMVQTLGGLRAWIQFTPLYFIGYEICSDEKYLWRVINVFILLAIICSIYGIIQYILGPAYFQEMSEVAKERHFNIYYATSKGLEFRVYSTFVQAGAFAGFLVFFLMIVVSNIFNYSRDTKYLIFNLIALIVMLVALILTGTRAAWIIFSVFLLVLIVLRGKFVNSIILIIVLLIGGYIGIYLTGGGAIERAMTLQEEGAIEVRYKGTFNYALNIVREYPMGRGLGYGGGIPSALSREFNIETSYTDSEFGRALVDMGWVGFFGFCIFAFLLFKNIVISYLNLRTKIANEIGPGIFVAICPVFFAIPVGNSLICTIPGSLYLWFFIGVLDGLAKLDYREINQ